MKEYNSILISNSKGFTLIEILIAVTLLAFITIGVVTVTENAMQAKERTTEVNKNNLQIETAMSRLEWDISQIYSPLYFSTILNPNQNLNQNANDPNQPPSGDPGFDPNNPLMNNPYLQQYYEQLMDRLSRNQNFSAISQEGLPIPRFHAPEKNIFEFFTSSNRRKLENTKQSHFAWVRYALASQDNLPSDQGENPAIPRSLKSLVRYVSADDPYSDKRIETDGSAGIKGAVLLRNVENLEFQFWDFNRRKWETSLRTIPGGENVIRGVKVSVTWYDSQGNKRTQTRTFRTHWPMVVQQDQAGNLRGRRNNQGGAQGGNQPGSNEDTTQ